MRNEHIVDALIEKLNEAGITRNEAKVYLGLLRRGSVGASRLSRELGLDRTLTYQLLNNLIEKGLASYIVKENKKYFEASDPGNLLARIKEHEKFVEALVRELKKIEKLKESENEVKVYEGKQGLKTLAEDLLKSRTMCAFGATGKSFDILKFERYHLIKRAQKLGIRGRIITSREFEGHEMVKLPSLKTRYLEEVKSLATTTIYDDKVSIHVLTHKPIIIIIKNKEVAEGYRNYFEFLWKQAKP